MLLEIVGTGEPLVTPGVSTDESLRVNVMSPLVATKIRDSSESSVAVGDLALVRLFTYKVADIQRALGMGTSGKKMIRTAKTGRQLTEPSLSLDIILVREVKAQASVSR